MIDKEIIKALECCINDDCDNCPDTFGNCEHNAMRNALDLINRQQAEIERLNKLIETRHKVFETKCEELDIAKSEAIKEFAERLKEIYRNIPTLWGTVAVKHIDNLVKEMVGEDK